MNKRAGRRFEAKGEYAYGKSQRKERWQAQGTDSSSLWLDHSVQVKNGIGALPGTVSRGTKNGLAFDIPHCRLSY